MSNLFPSLSNLLATDMNTPISPATLIAILTSPPFIPLPSSLNLRDLGMLPNSPIAPGLIYRSGAIHSIPSSSLATLNLDKILDLRSAREVAANSNPEIPGVKSVWVAADRAPKAVEMARFVEEGGVGGYRDMYMDILEVYRSSFKAGLHWILGHEKGRGGMLFHCTGISTSLTLPLHYEHISPIHFIPSRNSKYSLPQT